MLLPCLKVSEAENRFWGRYANHCVQYRPPLLPRARHALLRSKFTLRQITTVSTSVATVARPILQPVNLVPLEFQLYDKSELAAVGIKEPVLGNFQMDHDVLRQQLFNRPYTIGERHAVFLQLKRLGYQFHPGTNKPTQTVRKKDCELIVRNIGMLRHASALHSAIKNHVKTDSHKGNWLLDETQFAYERPFIQDIENGEEQQVRTDVLSVAEMSLGQESALNEQLMATLMIGYNGPADWLRVTTLLSRKWSMSVMTVCGVAMSSNKSVSLVIH